jgi:putative oxidoreductase
MSVKSLNEVLLSLSRVVVGLLFAAHGAQSLLGFPAKADGKTVTLAFGSWPGWWAAAIQLVGGILVMLGLGTRIAALVSSGSMAYAYFTVHQPKGLWPIQNSGEAAAMFCWFFLVIAILGPGKYAIDTWLTRSRKRPEMAAKASSGAGVTVA